MQIDGIQTAVTLQNNMSKPFQTIISSIQNVISTLNIMNSTRVDLNTSQVTAVNTMMRDTQANLVQLNRELGNGIQENTNQQVKFNNQLKNGLNPANGLLSTVKKIAATYIGISTVKRLVDKSSEMSDSLSRVNLINDGRQTTEQLNKMINKAALNTFSDYKGTLDMVTSLQISGGDLFTNREAIGFAEQVNKHLTLSGASSDAKQSVLGQLPKALASGKLQGNALNSVLANTPTIAQALMKYLDVDMKKLMEMGTAGKLTSQVLKNALFSVADETTEKFDNMPITMRDVLTNTATIFTTGLQPIFNSISQLASNKAFQEMLYSLAGIIATIANVGFNTFTMIASGIGLVSRNLNIVIPLLGVLTAALIIANGAAIAKFYTDKKALIVAKAEALWTGLRSAAMTALTTVQYAAAAAVSLFTKATVAQTAVQWKLNTAMLANPVGLIIVGVMLLIGLFFGAIAAINKFAGTSISAFGIIGGVIGVVVANIMNHFKLMLNTVMLVISTLYNHFATFAEFFANMFVDPVTAVKNLFLDLGENIIKILTTVSSVIDKVLGTDLSSGLSNFQNQLNTWRNENVKENKIKIPRWDPTYFQMTNLGGAWDKGYDIGENFKNNITGLKDKFLNPMGDNDMLNLLKGIEKNTGSTSDKLGLTTEEIKYLRDVAEQEAINRYTIASVRVEMTNNNNINSEMDVDGLIGKFYNGMAEAASTVAEGVV